jgi:hypothetical protein
MSEGKRPTSSAGCPVAGNQNPTAAGPHGTQPASELAAIRRRNGPLIA